MWNGKAFHFSRQELRREGPGEGEKVIFRKMDLEKALSTKEVRDYQPKSITVGI